MLEFINISYIKDDKIILEKISFKINKKDILLITGPNGSGKSTLAKLIIGIIKPTEGKILFNDEDITNLSITERAKKGITFTFQTPVVFKGLKVKDLLNIASGKSITFEEMRESLSMVGLCAREYIDRKIDKTLSGGELKRIEIATSLIKGSLLRIFDEPEAGIDLWSFDDLIKLFKTIKSENLGTQIIISHQEKLLNIADKIILLEKGKIKKIGNKKEIDSLLKIKSCSNCREEYHG